MCATRRKACPSCWAKWIGSAGSTAEKLVELKIVPTVSNMTVCSTQIIQNSASTRGVRSGDGGRAGGLSATIRFELSPRVHGRAEQATRRRGHGPLSRLPRNIRISKTMNPSEKAWPRYSWKSSLWPTDDTWQ